MGKFRELSIAVGLLCVFTAGVQAQTPVLDDALKEAVKKAAKALA